MATRIERALDFLGRKKTECGIVLKPENIYYLTNFFPSSTSALLLKPDPLLLVSKMDSTRLEDIDIEVRVVEKFKYEFKNLRYKRVAVEKKYATIDFYEKYLRGKRVSDLDFIEKMRVVKEKREVEKIKTAVRIAEDALKDVHLNLEGMTEREVAARVESFIRKRAKPAFDPIVASGKNASVPHHEPSGKKIMPEDLVIIDLGVSVGHYNSDISRTFTPTSNEDFLNIYSAVIEAQRAGIKEVKAGNEIKNVDKAVREVLREYGVEEEFLHSSGHGIGLEVHEAPRLSKDAEGKFERGSVITVEPGVYRELGVRIEDVVLVGKRPRVISRFEK